MIYLDDILIYSNNMSEHHRHVSEVLKCLRKAGLYAKAEKCKFHSESVEYLGYILSPSGLTMSDDKIKIIQDWPEPKKVKDIQSFLGFANFYCRFIFNYSDIVIPLTRLTRKDIPWKFDSSCQDAFNSLKKAFTSTPILTHWIPNAQLIVETDALDYALATILSVVNEDNEVHPVAFHSRTFTAAELNYDTHDKELLAIFEAFKIWQHYLEGPAYPIDIVTDHKNLEYFSTTKILTRRQVRWFEYLSQFNLVIRFCPGRLGTKPDALTRRWDIYPKGGNTGYATVNPHNFKPIFTNNLQPPYELWSFFFLLSAQLQSWIWTPYTKTSYRLSLVTQSLQNISPQMAGGPRTKTVYSSSTIEFMYHLLVTSAHVFSSTIMITSLPDILVKTKHWN